MAATYQVTFFVRLGNWLAKTLVQTGLKVGPIHLLTTRGRKSGQMRTVPVAIIQQDGQRYLIATFGLVNWVRNLQATDRAVLRRGRQIETIRAVELPPETAAPVLKRCLGTSAGKFFGQYFTVTAQSSLDDFEREVLKHPVFLIQAIE